MFDLHNNPLRFDKGQHLFHQGELLDRLFMIHKGLVKAYYTTFDGKELAKSFISEGGYISSLNALIADQPASFSVICLEPCEVSVVEKPSVLRLQQEKPEVMNQLLLDLAQKKERREYELLCLSAEQRYQKFLAEEPHLCNRLNQVEIASYLGITPVALCRIRKRIKG